MRCKNIPKGEKPSYYSGKENNPRGLGWSAKYEKEGKVRKGRDGYKYISKNGRWARKDKTSLYIHLTKEVKKYLINYIISENKIYTKKDIKFLQTLSYIQLQNIVKYIDNECVENKELRVLLL